MALILAAVEGHKDAALALIEAGADVDLTTSAGATAQKLAQSHVPRDHFGGYPGSYREAQEAVVNRLARSL